MDDYGYRTLVIPETHDPLRDITYMRELAKGLLAGFFIFNIEGENDPYVEALRFDNIKYVCIGYNPSVDNFVASRHDLGTESAVNHLVREHSCRRVAIITESAAKNADIDKLKGYRSALAANGIPASAGLVSSLDKMERFAEDLRKMLRPARSGRSGAAASPDALLVPHTAARAVESVLDELKMKAPRNIRIVLFDPPSVSPDDEYAHIRIHSAQVGQAAADKMFKLLKDSPDGPGGIFLGVDFHAGRSCGCGSAT
jgi:DNA-binding LacI/PurR family transcriptional regulator